MTEKTPLSDLIDGYEAAGTEESYSSFLDAFRSAKVGVMAFGAPSGTASDFKSSKEVPLRVGLSEDGEGRSVVLAFADPRAFIQNFGMQCNAEMMGEDVLRTVLESPNCYGVRVNNAKSEHSVLIPRETATFILSGGLQRRF